MHQKLRSAARQLLLAGGLPQRGGRDGQLPEPSVHQLTSTVLTAVIRVAATVWTGYVGDGTDPPLELDEEAVEVESRVKLIAGEREWLIGELAARRIALTEPVVQRDVYFAERGFRDRIHGPGSAIARIRYTPSETTLNMKRLTGHDGVWEEIETRIQDGIVAERILDAMGAELAVVIKKKRRSGVFGEIDIQLDDVEELGAYLELAVLADEEIGRARQAIDQLLRELDIPPDRSSCVATQYSFSNARVSPSPQGNVPPP